MAKQLLIYERASPVSKQSHADSSVKVGSDYHFAKEVNSVPLMVAEFANSAVEYTIVFGGQPGELIPVVLLGIRDGENLHVDQDGRWTGTYVPAFLRRYPFVFSSDDKATTFTLCVDEEFPGFNTEGRGERLFDSEGERTQYLQNVLGFLQAYQVQFQRTQVFTRRLEEYDLLEPMQAQFTLRSGQKLTLSGFSTINRERLKALSPERLATLMREDELELVYLHLHSLRNLTPMVERIGTVTASAPVEMPMADTQAPSAPLH